MSNRTCDRSSIMRSPVIVKAVIGWVGGNFVLFLKLQIVEGMGGVWLHCMVAVRECTSRCTYRRRTQLAIHLVCGRVLWLLRSNEFTGEYISIVITIKCLATMSTCRGS